MFTRQLVGRLIW